MGKGSRLYLWRRSGREKRNVKGIRVGRLSLGEAHEPEAFSSSSLAPVIEQEQLDANVVDGLDDTVVYAGLLAPRTVLGDLEEVEKHLTALLLVAPRPVSIILPVVYGKCGGVSIDSGHEAQRTAPLKDTKRQLTMVVPGRVDVNRLAQRLEVGICSEASIAPTQVVQGGRKADLAWSTVRRGEANCGEIRCQRQVTHEAQTNEIGVR
jgi:hypothetical protein